MPLQKEDVANYNETYNAITAAYKTIQHRVVEMLLEEGLTQPQFHALRMVAKRGRASMREISDELLATPPNITGIIDRLEARGLIERGAHETDRRTTIIELTPKGYALQERVATRYSEFIENALRVLTSDERRALRDLLAKLQKGMSQSGR